MTKDFIKAIISIIWIIFTLGLFIVGVDPADGEGFSLSFFVSIISGVLCFCYIKKWIDEDKEHFNPYDEHVKE